MREFDAWKVSRESRDTERYLAHYARDFASDGMDRSAWQAHKRRVNASKTWIKVSMTNLSAFRSPGKSALMVMTFDQDYRSSSLSQQSRKRQYWVVEGGLWKITYEAELRESELKLPESFRAPRLVPVVQRIPRSRDNRGEGSLTEGISRRHGGSAIGYRHDRLHRRTFDGTVRTKHAAVARLQSQERATAGTFVGIPASVSGHDLGCGRSAFGAADPRGASMSEASMPVCSRVRIQCGPQIRARAAAGAESESELVPAFIRCESSMLNHGSALVEIARRTNAQSNYRQSAIDFPTAALKTPRIQPLVQTPTIGTPSSTASP